MSEVVKDLRMGQNFFLQQHDDPKHTAGAPVE